MTALQGPRPDGVARPPGILAGLSGAWRVRAGVLAATLGALLIMFQPGIAVGIVGVVMVVIGAPLAWPGTRFGGAWYVVLVVGALLTALSPLVALAAELLGGWMGAVGALLIIAGAVAGMPGLHEAD